MRQSILSRVVLCLLIPTLPLTVRAGSFQLSEQSVSGLGTAFGALVGSLVVGLVVSVSTLWIPPELKNVRTAWISSRARA